MNYRIVDINGNPNYILKGIKLNSTNETCIYWTNINAKNINEVIIIFNNNNIRNIKENQICISLNGINDINSQRECLEAFLNQLRIMGIDKKTITFIFVISSRQEEPLIKEIKENLGLNSKIFINNIPKKEQNIDNNKKKETEKKINNEEELKGKSNIVDITKYNNNTRQNIIVDKKEKNAIDLSHEKLPFRELMKLKYRELINDPIEKEKLFKMTDKEVIEYVSSLIKIGKKNHKIEDSKINNATGIGINDPSKQNDITIHEKDGDKTNIKELESNKVDMSKPISSNTNNSTDSKIVQFEKQYQKPRKNPVREDTMIFTPQIPKAKSNDNVVSLDKHKTKVKKLTPPKNNYTEKSAAFISVPVIIFIISILLLIASGVIWLITK